MRIVQVYYPFLDQKQIGNKAAIREKDQLQHLKVLRVTSNNYSFVLADGKGRKCRSELVEFSKDGALFKLSEWVEIDKSKLGELDLFLPIIRPQKLEIILDQVTQLDIFNNIFLYFSDHNRRSEKTLSANKLARFEKKIIAAFQQSKSFYMPQLKLLDGDFQSHLEEKINSSMNLFLIPLTESEIKSDLNLGLNPKLISEELVGNLKSVSMIIGPEGGFSSKEITFFTEEIDEVDGNKAYTFSWGESILTTETASIALSSILKDILLQKSLKHQPN